ncbi:MAG TPA: phosphatase PAP2 family protein [Candidatus Limnocylindrales bacterium]|nr:phosphatase PAP2 family protein [Candidatus Limnocylindrales bacterium]
MQREVVLGYVDHAAGEPPRLPVGHSTIDHLRARNDRIVNIALAAYLGLLAILALVSGVRVTPDFVAVGIALAALMVARSWPPTRSRASIRDWSPYILIGLTYELIRGFGPLVLGTVHMQGVVDIERTLLGGRIAPEVLQDALRPLTGIDVLALVGTVVYLLHTTVSVVVGIYLWQRRRTVFYDFVAALVLLSIAGFATYLLFPEAPPWWAAAAGILDGASGVPVIVHLTPTALNTLVSSAGGNGPALVGVAFGAMDPDPVGAFPSLHAAYPLLAYLFLRKVSRRAGLLMLLYAAIVWFSIVYLGDHYLVDIIGGGLYAIAAFVALEAYRRLRPAGPPAGALVATGSHLAGSG